MWAAVVRFLGRFGGWIGGAIVGWGLAGGIKIIHGVLATGGIWIMAGIMRASKPIAHFVFSQVIETWKDPGEKWGIFVQDYLQQMTGEVISLKGIKEAGVMGGQHDAAAALGKAFLDPMLGLVMPTKEEADAQPMRGAEAFMSANLQFQMTAWLLHLYGDAISFGMFKSLKDLPNAISWSYGIGWLSWMVMGPIFRAGITAPMEKKFAEFYRYSPLSNAQIIDAYYAGLKSSEEMHKELAETGIEDTDIETMVKLSRKRFSEAQLEYMVSRGFRDRDSVIQYYKDMSFPQADAEAMAERLLTKRKRELIEDLVKSMEKKYTRGMLSEAELRQYYVDINYDLEEQNLAIAVLDIGVLEGGALTDAQIGRLRQDGKMPYEEALKRLEPRYADIRDAELFLELYPPKEVPEKVIKPTELSPSEIGRLYKMGKIEYGEALERLRTRVPPVAEPDLLLLLYERAEEKEIGELLKGLTPTQVGRLYQKEIINADEAIQWLIALKYPEDEAVLFLTLYPRVVPEVIVPPVRVLTPAQIASLFVSREMFYEEAISRLETLYYSREDADLLLISVSKEPIPPQIGRAYQLMTISSEEAIAALITWLYTEPEAIAYLETYPIA